MHDILDTGQAIRVLSLIDVQATLDAWRDDYNNQRPRGSLGQQTPAQFRARVSRQPGPDRLIKLRA